MPKVRAHAMRLLWASVGCDGLSSWQSLVLCFEIATAPHAVNGVCLMRLGGSQDCVMAVLALPAASSTLACIC